MIGFGYSGETAVESRSPLGALPGAIEEINFLRENENLRTKDFAFGS